MPVTNANSGITYRNYYCAVCNSDSVDIQFWRPRLACPTLTGEFAGGSSSLQPGDSYGTSRRDF